MGWLATDKQQTHGGSATLHPNFAPLHCAKLRDASTVEQNYMDKSSQEINDTYKKIS